MTVEKLESWEFCLSRKPSRTGWDVSTTRTGYGYENVGRGQELSQSGGKN